MKLMDDKGRICGLINIFDLMALIFLIVISLMMLKYIMRYAPSLPLGREDNSHLGSGPVKRPQFNTVKNKYLVEVHQLPELSWLKDRLSIGMKSRDNNAEVLSISADSVIFDVTAETAKNKPPFSKCGELLLGNVFDFKNDQIVFWGYIYSITPELFK